MLEVLTKEQTNMDYWRESSYFSYTSNTETETLNKQTKPWTPDEIEMMTPAGKNTEIKLNAKNIFWQMNWPE